MTCDRPDHIQYIEGIHGEDFIVELIDTFLEDAPAQVDN
jgi:hypothetical protein